MKEPLESLSELEIAVWLMISAVVALTLMFGAMLWPRSMPRMFPLRGRRGDSL